MIGREKEIQELMRRYNSGMTELVAVYGRRRVGKTYLVTETFQGRITFHHAGVSPVEGKKNGALKAQLEQFYYSLLMQGMKKSHRPSDWLEAFFMLEQLLESRDNGSRQVVFLDELPWMDTPRSGFITAFEGFWNNWACYHSNLMVIVCGSASSWMLDKLINNHGGLYNRITCQIKLKPFTLKESESFYASMGVRMSRYDITQSYMILGGIPYYMRYFENGLSLPQNVDKLFFTSNADLPDEFDRLFSSVFNNPETMKTLISFIGTRSRGFTRKEIAEGVGVTEGGKLSDDLHALTASDFIVRYVPFGFSKREEHYKLVDPFCVFWLHFMAGQKKNDAHFWENSQNLSNITAWRGLAFELTCFNHIDQIKEALGISGVQTAHSAWLKRSDAAQGTQIDMLIERNDNVVNSCEIKFCGSDFKVDKAYYRILLERQEILKKSVSPKMAIHNTLITTFGLVYNEYSGIFTNVITLEDLFH